MKIIAISDTHQYHNFLKIPMCDILIHAGDFCNYDRKEEVDSFLTWFASQPAKYKIFIAGNHDLLYDSNFYPDFQDKKIFYPKYYNSIYLENNGINIEGLNIWGSPYSCDFGGWAFMKKDKDLQSIWNQIPDATDILITHSPPFGVLDKTTKNLNVGSKTLRNKVRKIKPKIHIFGHIHEASGIKKINKTKFINASMWNYNNLETLNKPIIIEINYKITKINRRINDVDLSNM
jgi:Icc-related predicted phosphoesterase